MRCEYRVKVEKIIKARLPLGPILGNQSILVNETMPTKTTVGVSNQDSWTWEVEVEYVLCEGGVN